MPQVRHPIQLRLKELQERSGLSDTQIAIQLGISEKTWRRILGRYGDNNQLRGVEFQKGVNIITGCARLFGCSTDDILKGDGND